MLARAKEEAMVESFMFRKKAWFFMFIRIWVYEGNVIRSKSDFLHWMIGMHKRVTGSHSTLQKVSTILYGKNGGQY